MLLGFENDVKLFNNMYLPKFRNIIIIIIKRMNMNMSKMLKHLKSCTQINIQALPLY